MKYHYASAILATMCSRRSLGAVLAAAILFGRIAPAEAQSAGQIASGGISAAVDGVIDRSVPGSRIPIDGNHALRQPTKAQIADRIAAAQRLATWRAARPRPLQFDGNDPNFIPRVHHSQKLLLKSMIASGVTANSLAVYADKLVPLFQYLDAVNQHRALVTIKTAPTVTLRPGQALRFDLNGYCMDSNLPAPAGGEKMYLRSEDDLVPKPVRAVFDAVVSFAHSHNYDHAYVQNTVWFLRQLGSNAIDPDQKSEVRNLIELAYPGGWQIVVDYADGVIAKKHKKQLFHDLAMSALSLSGAAPALNALASSAGSLADTAGSITASAREMKASTNALLGSISATAPNQPIPEDLSAISHTSSGLDVVIGGTGPIRASGVAVNTSDHNVVVPLNTPYVAESERVTQRIVDMMANPQVSGVSNVNPQAANAAKNQIALSIADILGLPKMAKLSDDILSTVQDGCDLLGLRNLLACMSPISKTINALSGGLAILNMAHGVQYGTDMENNPIGAWQFIAFATILAGGAAVAIGLAPEILAAAGVEVGATAEVALNEALATGFRSVATQSEALSAPCTLFSAIKAPVDLENANLRSPVAAWTGVQLGQTMADFRDLFTH